MKINIKKQMHDSKDLAEIKKLLDIAEAKIMAAKQKLFSDEISQKAENVEIKNDDDAIFGVFDGEKMVAKDKKEYQVPPNYASKSKLLPGDTLKLSISEDGRYLFKQVNPIDRKNEIGVLEMVGEGNYQVDIKGKKYRVLLASITYFKAKPGDKLSLVIPKDSESEWAAVDNIV